MNRAGDSFLKIGVEIWFEEKVEKNTLDLYSTNCAVMTSYDECSKKNPLVLEFQVVHTLRTPSEILLDFKRQIRRMDEVRFSRLSM